MKDRYAFSELGFNPLFTALAEGREVARKIYPEISPLHERIRETCEMVGARSGIHKANREVLVQILEEIHPHKGHPKVKENLALCENENSFFIVSGQQVGVLGGPLYTLIKACAVVSLSEWLNEKVAGFRFIPLFWASGMDHDYEEVSQFRFVDRDDVLKSVSISQVEGTQGFPLSRVVLGEKQEAEIKEIFSQMKGVDSPSLASLVSHYKAGRTLTDSFVGLYSETLAERGMLFFDPETPLAKESARNLFIDSLSRWRDELGVVKVATGELESLGFAPQVRIRANETNLFLLDSEGVRRKLVSDDGEFHLKGHLEDGSDSIRIAQRELEKVALEDSSRFSVNVLLRPLYQQYLIPTVAYIGGPSEVAYWAQIYPLFRLYNFPYPLLLPRPSFTLTPSRVARVLEKYNLDLTRLQRPSHDLISEVAQEFIPQSVTRKFGDFSGEFRRLSLELRESAVQLDPNLDSVFQTLEKSFEKYLSKLEKKVIHAVKEKNETLGRSVESLYTWVMPNGELQERGLSSLQFLALYGIGLTDELISSCEFPPSAHKIIRV